MVEARFFCETGALAGADYRIGGDATIGRGPSNAIVVDDGAVSKTHARIAFDAAAAAWFLEDLGSMNGTRLDGAPVSGRIRLRDLHVVTLGGRHDFIFVVPEPAGKADDGAAAPAARPSDAGAPGVGASGTRHERAPVLSVPPLASSGGRSSASGTRHERAPVLSVPPLASGGDPGAVGVGDSSPEGAGSRGASSSGGRSSASGTRHERAPVLSVPPLASGGDPGAVGVGDSSPEGAGSRGASSSGGRSSASGTRYEPAPVLSVPPLASGGDPGADATGDPPRAAGDGPAVAGGQAAPPVAVSFEVRIAGGEPRRVRLGDGRHVVGRAKGCDVPIDDRTLSRRHAAFVVRGGRVTVDDLGSLNGTFVDGTRVGEETEVGAGGVVGLGECVTVVRVAP